MELPATQMRCEQSKNDCNALIAAAIDTKVLPADQFGLPPTETRCDRRKNAARGPKRGQRHLKGMGGTTKPIAWAGPAGLSLD